MIRIIKLVGVFVRWCVSDIIENFHDIRIRYKLEKDEEFNRMIKEIEEDL